jgi:hypothetical protein
MASNPQIPPVNAGELYLNGLQISISEEETHINVKRGAARNSTNVNDILVPDDTIARLERSGLNGLDTGTAAANMLYAVYAIGSSVAAPGNGQSVSPYPAGILLSREFTRPYMPVGYDMYRRIGAILTDVDGNIVPFVQVGNDTNRTMRYGYGGPLLTFGNSTDWFEISVNTQFGFEVMPFIATNIHISTSYTTPDLFDSFYLQPTGQPDGPYYNVGSGVIINEVFHETMTAQCNADTSFNYQLDDNAGSLSITFRGYDDLL